ncbi:hypothetical protein Poli38472_004227 [Pythium oligandrum]|uniref:Transmembrane protein n=1 Tax=Pythium oligandrum TaxID=41045 RepID=A0A8K1CPW2_PYTOL|nr:hypothetical protein Poli38472_004227 [Pythium oligandrum]|eukprot:TMW66462.1 hypothetical protein Poli38472_004227 [Pythium oligandrum]
MATLAKVATAKVLIQPLGHKPPSISSINTTRTAKVGKCPTPWQLFHLTRRLLGLAAAIFFVHATVESAVYGLVTLYGAVQYNSNYGSYVATLIPDYVGTKTIKESRLFNQVLGADSSPRQDAFYLQSVERVTNTKCEDIDNGVIEWLYSNKFLRSNWHDLVTRTSYNLTYLQDSELVAPVVDCSFTAITMGDITSARVFYLMRKKADPMTVFLVVTSISTQDYEVPDEFLQGAAAVVALAVIDDMRVDKVTNSFALALGYPLEGPWYSVYTFESVTDDGFVVLRNVPEDPNTEYRRRVYTANRSGFYLKSEESQSNINNMHWTIYDNPLLTMTKWQWAGCSVLKNSWGWVRCVYFVFAVYTIFNLLVLMIVVYRNFQRGKIWIGDAFISISGSLFLRGATVLVVWAMENFWQVSAAAVRYGSVIGNIVRVFTFPQIMHGDLISLYVCLAGFLGTVLHERIDPALTIFLFELGYRYRFEIGAWLPALKSLVIAHAVEDYLSGIATIPPELNSFCPFGFWTIHEMLKDASAAIGYITPNMMTFVIIIVYAVIRKAYRRAYPSRAVAYSSRITKGSSNLSEGKGMKSPFTMFELATGAELQNKVGIVSDYDNCVYIKGIRYASADGIYCNGFVIANGQWLIHTSDILSVVLIILTGSRLRGVFVYEVKDHKASQTARLVYPNTMKLSDLTKLNTTVLV